MKRILAMLAGAVAAVTLVCAATTWAQEFGEHVEGCDVGWCNGDACGCGRGGLFAAAELTFMKYMQEGGVADADGTGANFDLRLAPRFELGYKSRGNLGWRARYWEYDETTLASDGDQIGLETYYVDGEFFYTRRLGRTAIELAGGLRYFDFKQDLQGYEGTELVIGEFEGFGATLGLEAKHPFWIGSVYARGRWSVLLGNNDLWYDSGTTITTSRAHDSQSTMTELGVGYEVARHLGSWGMAAVRFGGEWQSWANVAPADVIFGGIGNDDVLENAGFAGLVARFELRR